VVGGLHGRFYCRYVSARELLRHWSVRTGNHAEVETRFKYDICPPSRERDAAKCARDESKQAASMKKLSKKSTHAVVATAPTGSRVSCSVSYDAIDTEFLNAISFSLKGIKVLCDGQLLKRPEKEYFDPVEVWRITLRHFIDIIKDRKQTRIIWMKCRRVVRCAVKGQMPW
jgi:hypothetical protein